MLTEDHMYDDHLVSIGWKVRAVGANTDHADNFPFLRGDHPREYVLRYGG